MKKYILFLGLTLFICSNQLFAQNPLIGEVKLFAGNFAPRGWAFCDGQLLPIAQNTALFSLLGTNYGGDGRTTFGLPDLRGRVAIGVGSGPGLSSVPIGEKKGVEAVTLNELQIPAHDHNVQLRVSGESSNSTTPSASTVIGADQEIYTEGTPNVKIKAGSISQSSIGGNQAHTNLQPYVGMRYIIALQGIYPTRS